MDYGTENKKLVSRQREDEKRQNMLLRQIFTAPQTTHTELPKRKGHSIGMQFEMARLGARWHLEQYLKFYRPQYRTRTGPASSSVDQWIWNSTISENSPVNMHAARFSVVYESLEDELHTLYSLLEEIQKSEWCYWQFPFVPKRLLFCCSFAFAWGVAKRVERKNDATLAAINLDIEFLKNKELPHAATTIISRMREQNQDLYINRPIPVSGVASRTCHILEKGEGTRISSLIEANAVLEGQRLNVLAAITRTHMLGKMLAIGLGISAVWTLYRVIRYGTIVWCKYSLAALIRRMENNKLSHKDENALGGLFWSILWHINIIL